jgi:hypothetical protein
VQIKRNEIDDALSGDPEPLPLLHLERGTRILRHNLTLQDSHACGPLDNACQACGFFHHVP